MVVGVLLLIRFHFDSDAESSCFDDPRLTNSSTSDETSLPAPTNSSSVASEAIKSKAAFFIGEFQGVAADVSTQTENDDVIHTKSDADPKSQASLPEACPNCACSSFTAAQSPVSPDSSSSSSSPRSEEECLRVFNDKNSGPSYLSDKEILLLVSRRKILPYNLGRCSPATFPWFPE